MYSLKVLSSRKKETDGFIPMLHQYITQGKGNSVIPVQFIKHSCTKQKQENINVLSFLS